MVERETADEIEAAAAEWVWRLEQHGRNETVNVQLEQWLAEDPRRRGAFLKAEAVFAAVARGHEPERASAPASRKQALNRRAVLLASGAGIAAAAGALVVGLPRERYGTKTGEIRRIPLKDGSIAAINTESNVEVAMSAQQRVVKIGRGEAWFQVAKNPERPFIVEAGRIRVQAIGTAFSVRRRRSGADVLVTEGVVSVWSEGAEGHKIAVSAGSAAYVADNSAINKTEAPPSEIDRKLAWRTGKIDLAGETLEEAAADFNRYNERKIVVSDAGLAKERLYGVFRTNDPLGFAMAVHQSLGAGVESEGASEIRIVGPNR
jgi:transmembrane sensor